MEIIGSVLKITMTKLDYSHVKCKSVLLPLFKHSCLSGGKQKRLFKKKRLAPDLNVQLKWLP